MNSPSAVSLSHTLIHCLISAMHDSSSHARVITLSGSVEMQSWSNHRHFFLLLYDIFGFFLSLSFTLDLLKSLALKLQTTNHRLSLFQWTLLQHVKTFFLRPGCLPLADRTTSSDVSPVFNPRPRFCVCLVDTDCRPGWLRVHSVGLPAGLPWLWLACHSFPASRRYPDNRVCLPGLQQFSDVHT